MTLNIFYKQFSGNDSFETPKDRKSIYLDKLEADYPGIFCTMEKALFGSFSDEGFYATSVPQSSTGYVITNKTSCGAIALFYSGAMERFAKEIGSFFVIPSSTEEVILMPGTDSTGINEMIREVNAQCVEDDLVLDSHAYFYDKATGTLKPVVSLRDSIAERRLA
jgi:hypothetical protein